VYELSHFFDVDLLVVNKSFKQEIKYIRKVMSKVQFFGFVYYTWQKFKEHRFLKIFLKKELVVGRTGFRKFEFKENSQALCAHLRKVKYDFILLGKSGLLDRCVLQSGDFKFLNVHPAKLPEFRGYAEPAHAIMLGKRDDVGFSIHWVDEGIDTGRIIEWIPVEYRDGCSLTELLSWVRFQGFKHFLSMAKNINVLVNENNNSEPDFPILTFLNWRIRRKLERNIRKVNILSLF
jgi:folate-dependent phosphoribosylglycinamide formyltransferase PurN